MVLVRCGDHEPQPEDTKHNYVAAVEPVGYPETGIVCGREGAGHGVPGLVYLDENEYERYRQGKRVYEPNTHTTHIRVRDPVVTKL